MKRMTIGIFLFVAFSLVGWAQEREPSPWQAGKHYSVLSSPQPTQVQPGEIEVIEVLSYTCSHCYRFEPQLADWIKKKSTYVRFSRLPAVWDDNRRALTQLHYALEELGRSDAQIAILEATQKDRHSLYSRVTQETYEKQLAFAEKHGIAAADFGRAYNSPRVLAKVKRAEGLLVSYRIESTPTLIINGKYTVGAHQVDRPMKKGENGERAEDFSQLLAVASYLVALEQRLNEKRLTSAKR